MLVTGLSGNEIYCLAQKGWAPGNIVVGNSVNSLGIISGVASGFRTLAGGELEAVTELIADGRHAALARMEDEAAKQNAHGLTGVATELKQVGGLTEFIAVGSAVKGSDYGGQLFTSACTGQDFYCHLDAGYTPKHFVIGNVAYALGVGRGFMGALRSMAGGEVKEFSDMYNKTRHMALNRLEKEATERGANAVVDVHTYVLPFGPGVKEMLMVGTASTNGALNSSSRPVTSELTGEELWNLTRMGYQPMRLLLGTSVYALGIGGGIKALFSSLSKGEVNSVTKLIYEARENCLHHIHQEANEIGADGVIGVKLFIDEIGASFVEVMAIGTAIKKNPSVKTAAKDLIPQAIIRDRDTFFDVSGTFGIHGSLQRK